jgi:hypothetical protein
MVAITPDQLEAIARHQFSPPEAIAPYILGMWLDSAAMGTVFIMTVQWARLGWKQESKLTKGLVVCLFHFAPIIIRADV